MVSIRTILSLLRRRRKPTVEVMEIAPTKLPPPSAIMPMMPTGPIMKPMPTSIRGGGSGGIRIVRPSPQQTFAAPEDIQQSIPVSEPQFTLLPTVLPPPTTRRGGVTRTISEQFLVPDPILPPILPTKEQTETALRQQLDLPTGRRIIPLERLGRQRFDNGIELIGRRRRRTPRISGFTDITGLSFTEIITTGLQTGFSPLPREDFPIQVPRRVKKIRKKKRIRKKPKRKKR